MRHALLIALVAACGAFGCTRGPAHGPDSGGRPPGVTTGRWVTGPRAGDQDLLAVDFVDATHGWAVGDIAPSGSAIMFSPDGGHTWRAVTATTEVLASVCFVTAERGWVAGYAGQIRRTDDGGRTWLTLRSERESEVINSIFFVDSTHGWAAGGSGLLLRTVDGGATWLPVSVSPQTDLWSVRFATIDRGWIIGEGGLLQTSLDGGATWRPVATGTTKALMGLAVAADGTAVAVGEDGTILRTDDGVAWVTVASPTEDSLNSVATDGAGVFRAVGSSGTCVTSRDAGRTWTLDEPASRNTLAAISAIDADHAVAVGRHGFTQLLD
ncbi:MAG TPA: YCF48-related protein [Blastocatellia bacterium]|nr:YCF48-related protein [Blastocatellia bacterium]